MRLCFLSVILNLNKEQQESGALIMARGIIRKPSFNKIVGAYRSQWKRFWMRLFTFGVYGSKGVGWLRDPKKAWYNFWYSRTSVSVYRLLGCKPSRLACFFAMIVAAVATPIDATSAGVKAHKIKKERKKRESGERNTGSTSTTGSARSTSGSSTTHSTVSTSTPRTTVYTHTTRATAARRSTTSTPKATSTTVSKNTTEKKTVTTVASRSVEEEPPAKKTQSTYTYTPIYQPTVAEVKPIVEEPELPKEPDENTPKSIPKHENDQYIRKRMIIAGSSYCDSGVLAKLSVGTCFDMIVEPDNPHDKDAVMLTLDGEKIGYIAKADRLAFVTCLKLKRKIYGVITDIKADEFPTKYEFETWFDSER